MPRKAYLAKHYSAEELKKRYLKSRDTVESRRWHVLWKISLGWTIKNSAIAVGINYDYAQELVRNYNKLGAKALKNGHKQHRYEWLYVYGFVKPKTGKTLWYLIPRVNIKWLNIVYQNFAVDAGISQKKVLLVEDNAGWHRSKKVEVPEGITLEFLPHILQNYNQLKGYGL